MTVADAIIVGGGLHGLSTALHLARAGLQPLLLEKEAHSGRHASGVNAGGVRRLGRHFAEVPLAVASLELWHDINELVDDDCGFQACGQIKVAETEAELEQLTARVEELRRQGFEHEVIIDANELRELVPALAPHCVGAVWCRDDGAANPYRTVQAFRRKAQTLGAEIRYGAAVTAIERVGQGWQVRAAAETFSAPLVINCAGAWGADICRMIGDPLPPLRIEAPMLMISERTAPFLTPVLGAAGRTLSFKQFANGTVLIGGGYRGQALPARNQTWLDFRGLSQSAQTVAALFPQLASLNIVRCWAGIEGVTVDGIPVIGPSPTAEGAYHAFGFSAHGFQLGPIVGKLLAELITGGRSPQPIAAFRLGRFNDPAPSQKS